MSGALVKKVYYYCTDPQGIAKHTTHTYMQEKKVILLGTDNHNNIIMAMIEPPL